MNTDLNRILHDVGQTIAEGRSGVVETSFELIIWNGLEAGETGTPTAFLRYHQGMIISSNPTLEGATLDLYRELERRFGKKRRQRDLAEVPAIFTQIMRTLGAIGLAIQKRFDGPTIGRYGTPRFRLSIRIFADRPTVGVVFFDNDLNPVSFTSGGGDAQEALDLTIAKAARYVETH